jgi:hypothetical protein
MDGLGSGGDAEMIAAKELLAQLTGSENGNGKAPESVPLRAFAWGRVSTDEQGERGESIQEQLRQVRAHAERQGIEIVGEYQEVGSAFQREDRRVEFHRMIEEAKKREDVNAILVHDFSRFSRDSLRAQMLIRELREAGVQVLSASDPNFDPETSHGVYLEHFTHAKNEAYSRDIAFHTIKGCRANVQSRDPVTGWCYKNGGQPLFGYRTKQVNRGGEKRGRPIAKSIWELDNTEIAGKPLHEWVKHCLLMAADGASLNQLRDFCNEKGFPARRKSHWGISTWNALLQPHVLMKYCGIEIWGMRDKKGRTQQRDKWVVVENAHPAILTPEEAKQIVEARKKQGGKTNGLPKGRSRNSPYLLSGGLFKCGRCGANMTGLKGTSGTHYVCGSLPYRRGKGCGKGVYVPVKLIEKEAIRGLREVVSDCTDPKGFARLVNEELKRIWQQQNGPDLEAKRKLKSVEKKMANVRKAIEDGINDAEWANRAGDGL